MKKYLYLIIATLILGTGTVYAAPRIFDSQQVGSNPQNGYILSTDGLNSTWIVNTGGGGSSQWTTNGSSIYYNTGNVGIGTTSPYAKLSVAGAVVGESFFASSTTATNYFGGNVGIGTTTPLGKLHVVGSDNNGSTAALMVGTGVGGTLLLDGNEIDVSGNNDLLMNFNTRGDILLVNGGGKIGIGTTTPYAKLSVVGTTTAQNFVATSTHANLFKGDLYIGNAVNPLLDAFGTKNYELQILSDVNDINGIAIHNKNTGTTAGGGIFFSNSKSPTTGIGALQTYYGGLIFPGGGWNGLALGLDGAKANDLGVYTTDGNLVLGAASSSASNPTRVGNIVFNSGAGSLVDEIPDAIFTWDNKFGIGTTSPYSKLAVVGETVSSFYTATTTTATTTFAGGFVVGPPSISGFKTFTVQNTSGDVGINTATPLGLLGIAGTYTTQKARVMTNSTTFISSETSNQYGFENRPRFQPSGDSISNLYAFLNIPVFNSNLAPTTVVGTYSRIDTLAGSVGTIGTTIDFEAVTGTFSGATTTNQMGMRVGAMSTGVNNAGIVIGEASTGNNSNLILGQTTIPTGSYSIYNSSTDSNYFNGNIGIGSSTPPAPLTVFSNQDDVAIFERVNTSATTPPALVLNNPTGNQNTAFSLVFRNASSERARITFGRGAGINPFISFATDLAATERMRITNSGFVGIGTTSPYTALSVAGSGGVVAESFTATSTTATSTILGSLNIGVATSTGPRSTLYIGGSAYVETQTLATSTSMSLDFCTTRNNAVMGVGTDNITFTWTNANLCPGKSILLSNYAPLTGLIGTTTFSGGSNSGPVIWSGGVNPGSSVVNGTTDDFCFVSSATSTSYISASLCGQH